MWTRRPVAARAAVRTALAALGALGAALAGCVDAPPTATGVRPAPSVSAGAAATATLALGAAGTGKGTVTSGGGEITCYATAGSLGGTCWSTFATGAVVTLTATPDAGSVFHGWNGPCTGTGSCQVALAQSANVIATFLPASSAMLTLGVSGTGRGTVTSSPGGILCYAMAGTLGGTCWSSFASGTEVALTAVPEAGHVFLGWTGACTGTGTCRPALGPSTSVVASFIPVPAFGLQIFSAGTGTGAVTSTPAGIACTVDGATRTGACWYPFPNGSAVTLTATPGTDSRFVGWTNACAGDQSSCTITMSAERTAIASFNSTLPVPTIAPMLTATVVGPRQVSLTWTNSDPNAREVHIVRDRDVESGMTVARLPVGDASYVDTGLLPGTRYWYFASACNRSGCSGFGEFVSVTTEREFLPMEPNVWLRQQTVFGGSALWYVMTVPPGMGYLRVETDGNNLQGIVNLHLRHGSPDAPPACSATEGPEVADRRCTVLSPAAGAWYVEVRAGVVGHTVDVRNWVGPGSPPP